MNSYVIKVKQPKLTKEERKKLRVIKRLINKEINGPKAAKMLKVTPRQIRNLKREILLNGDMGIIHKNRFNKPINTYDEEIRQDIASTYRKNYKGMNFTQFSKVIQEEKGYTMSRSTIYNILRQKRIRSPQRKRNIKK
ncbi:MAG: hypothetical protein ACOX4W_00575 [Bacilli bacterium]|jgi:hypothetical protein